MAPTAVHSGDGALKTAIWHKSLLNGNPYKGTAYETAFAKFGTMMQRAERDGATLESIDEFIRTVLEAPRPKARYVFTPGRFLNWTLPTMLSHASLDGVLSRMIGLKKPRRHLLPAE